MDELLLGVDIGTSACKVAAHTLGGVGVAVATHGYTVHTPAPGHVEQDAEDWWAAACAGITDVCRQVDPRRIAAVGVAGQSWSAVPVDEAGRVLARTPIWQDTRAAELCAAAEQRVGPERILAASGNRFSPSYTTGKILWFAEHRPAVHRATRWYLQSNAFVVQRLTGAVTTDLSQAYGLHVVGLDGRYDPALAAELGIDLAVLPRLVAPHDVVGTVTDDVARRTGLRAGTPVVAGGLDAACATLGAGVHVTGQVQEQGGQAGGMSIVVDAPVPQARLILSRHVVPGRFLLQGGTAAGGASLRWAAGVLDPARVPDGEDGEGGEGGDEDLYEEISRLAGSARPGASGVVFLPYLAGERSPLWDPAARGVLFGLTLSTTRADVYRAVMEGVAFSLRHNLEVAAEVGAEVRQMHAVGGAATSPVWTQVKADVTGSRMLVPVAPSATTLGAAVVAGVGTGWYGGWEEAVERTVRVGRTHEPDPTTSAVYDEAYAVYRDLYRRLAPVMAARAGTAAAG